MEHPRSSLPPPSRLLPYKMLLLPDSGDGHHIPRQLRRSRTRHELHHKEIARLWISSHDASAPDCDDPAVEILPWENYS